MSFSRGLHTGSHPCIVVYMISYRVQAASHDTAMLLDPAFQVSESYCTEDVKVGVSGCTSLKELADYLAQSGVPFDATCVVVEMEGDASDDDPEDAHLGEVLIMPERIVSVTPITEALLPLIDAAFDRMNP